MKIRIVGSGTCIPSLTRGPSSSLLSIDNYNILVDIGPSVVRRLLEFGFEVYDIDIILLTHFHVDHTADLSTFLFACNYGRKERRRPLLIIGGRGLTRFYKDLLRVYPWNRPISYKLSVKPLPSGTIKIDGLTLTTSRARHNRESTAFRIDKDGKSLVFTGDTGYSRGLIDLAKGSNLLVAECSFPIKEVKGHLSLKTLDRIVGKARPERVIITHLYPEWDDFKGILPPTYLMAEDGMEIIV